MKVSEILYNLKLWMVKLESGDDLVLDDFDHALKSITHTLSILPPSERSAFVVELSLQFNAKCKVDSRRLINFLCALVCASGDDDDCHTTFWNRMRLDKASPTSFTSLVDYLKSHVAWFNIEFNQTTSNKPNPPDPARSYLAELKKLLDKNKVKSKGKKSNKSHIFTVEFEEKIVHVPMETESEGEEEEEVPIPVKKGKGTKKKDENPLGKRCVGRLFDIFNL